MDACEQVVEILLRLMCKRFFFVLVILAILDVVAVVAEGQRTGGDDGGWSL